ncbi:MAG TPA: hypothetical protein DCO75_06860, partial [Fibrobacteres bacterium]|nr:hypothetical protein [Fibrobacterota bacterium]
IILIQTTLRGCRPEEFQNFTKGARRPPGTEAFSPKVFFRVHSIAQIPFASGITYFHFGLIATHKEIKI